MDHPRNILKMGKKIINKLSMENKAAKLLLKLIKIQRIKAIFGFSAMWVDLCNSHRQVPNLIDCDYYY